MIQRKQSVFLLVAAILTIVCLCLPIGVFHPKNLGVDTAMYNLWIQYGNGSVSYTVCPLFCILLMLFSHGCSKGSWMQTSKSVLYQYCHWFQ